MIYIYIYNNNNDNIIKTNDNKLHILKAKNRKEKINYDLR